MEKTKFSPEEIALAAARDIVTVMYPRLKEADEELFIQVFVKKALELLEEKGDVFIGIIAYEDKYFDLITKEASVIFQFIDENIQKEYTFRNGRLLIYFNKEEGTGIWEGD